MRDAWKLHAACRPDGPHGDVADVMVAIPGEGRGNAASIEHKTNEEERLDYALSICRLCPVRQECLDYAVRTRASHGVWGGLDADEIRRLRRRRREASRRKVLASNAAAG